MKFNKQQLKRLRTEFDNLEDSAVEYCLEKIDFSPREWLFDEDKPLYEALYKIEVSDEPLTEDEEKLVAEWLAK